MVLQCAAWLATPSGQTDEVRPVTAADLARPVRLGHPLIPSSAVDRPGTECFEALYEWSSLLPLEPSGWRRIFYEPAIYDMTFNDDEVVNREANGVPLPRRWATASPPIPVRECPSEQIPGNRLTPATGADTVVFVSK